MATFYHIIAVQYKLLDLELGKSRHAAYPKSTAKGAFLNRNR